MASGQIPPPKAGRFMEVSPFGPDAGLLLHVDNDLKATSIQVIRNRLNFPDLQAFDSGAFGNVNEYQIWGFKAGIMATQVALLVALGSDMAKQPMPPKAPEWQPKIKALNEALETVYELSLNLCNGVDKKIIDEHLGS